VAATATKGRVVVAGVCAEPDPYLPVMALLKELTISFSVYYRPEEFEFVINAFETGQIDPDPLVTRIVALEQLDSAFASLAGTATESKILVDPRQVLAARGG
jgi:(R,R)-butanediol dehydrogenase/meso-butanediol dehydrogenase/diacetyl reductase